MIFAAPHESAVGTQEPSWSALGRSAYRSAADYDAGALSSLEPQLLTHLRHWLCTAAMVLMPGLSPIKVLV